MCSVHMNGHVLFVFFSLEFNCSQTQHTHTSECVRMCVHGIFLYFLFVFS